MNYTHKIQIRVTDDMYKWLITKPDMSQFLRDMIYKAMINDSNNS